MGRGKKLTVVEISQFQILRLNGKTDWNGSFAQEIAQSVCNYFKQEENYGKNHPGTKSKLDDDGNDEFSRRLATKVYPVLK